MLKQCLENKRSGCWREVGDWSWLWYLSNYGWLHLREYACWKLVSTVFILMKFVEATWWRNGVTSLTHLVKKNKPTSTQDQVCLCLCAAVLLSRLCRKHAEMTRREQERLVIANKAFIFQLLQLFREIWNQISKTRFDSFSPFCTI